MITFKLHSKITTFILSIALAVLSAGAAVAGTNGDTVSATYYFPLEDSTYAEMGIGVVSGAGAVFHGPGESFQLLVTDTQIIAQNFFTPGFWAPSDFNGFKVTDLTKNFSSSYSIDSSTNMIGFGTTNVSVSGNIATINWQGLSVDENTRVVLNITAVPEPETYAMMLVGLGLVGAIARRRKLA